MVDLPSALCPIPKTRLKNLLTRLSDCYHNIRGMPLLLRQYVGELKGGKEDEIPLHVTGRMHIPGGMHCIGTALKVCICARV